MANHLITEILNPDLELPYLATTLAHVAQETQPHAYTELCQHFVMRIHDFLVSVGDMDSILHARVDLAGIPLVRVALFLDFIAQPLRDYDDGIYNDLLTSAIGVCAQLHSWVMVLCIVRYWNNFAIPVVSLWQHAEEADPDLWGPTMYFFTLTANQCTRTIVECLSEDVHIPIEFQKLPGLLGPELTSVLMGVLQQPVWWNVSNTQLPQVIHCQTDVNIFEAGFAEAVGALCESYRMLNWGVLDYLGLAILSFIGAAQHFNGCKTSEATLCDVKEELARLVTKIHKQESTRDKGKGKAQGSAQKTAKTKNKKAPADIETMGDANVLPDEVPPQVQGDPAENGAMQMAGDDDEPPPNAGKGKKRMPAYPKAGEDAALIVTGRTRSKGTAALEKKRLAEEKQGDGDEEPKPPQAKKQKGGRSVVEVQVPPKPKPATKKAAAAASRRKKSY